MKTAYELANSKNMTARYLEDLRYIRVETPDELVLVVQLEFPSYTDINKVHNFGYALAAVIEDVKT